MAVKNNETAAEKLIRMMEDGEAFTSVVEIETILSDPEKYQSRTETDQGHIELVGRWMNEMTSGGKREFIERVPPVVLFQDPEGDIESGGERFGYRLADGFHRLDAAKAMGWSEVFATIIKGGHAECLEYSVSANLVSTAKTPTKKDRIKAAKTLLTDKNHWLRSLNEISKMCGISASSVQSAYRELESKDESLVSPVFVDHAGKSLPRFFRKNGMPAVNQRSDNCWSFTYKQKPYYLTASNKEEAQVLAVQKIEYLSSLENQAVDLSLADSKIRASLRDMRVDCSIIEVVGNSACVIRCDDYVIAICRKADARDFLVAKAIFSIYESRFGDEHRKVVFSRPSKVVAPTVKMAIKILQDEGVEIESPDNFIRRYYDIHGISDKMDSYPEGHESDCVSDLTASA